MEYEKQQSEVTKQSKQLISKLEGSYKEAENLITDIRKKQLELSAARKELWTTILVMAVIVAGTVLARIYL